MATYTNKYVTLEGEEPKPMSVNYKGLKPGRVYVCVKQGHSIYGVGRVFLAIRKAGKFGDVSLFDLKDMDIFEPSTDSTLFQELTYVTNVNIKVPFETVTA